MSDIYETARRVRSGIGGVIQPGGGSSPMDTFRRQQEIRRRQQESLNRGFDEIRNTINDIYAARRHDRELERRREEDEWRRDEQRREERAWRDRGATREVVMRERASEDARERNGRRWSERVASERRWRAEANRIAQRRAESVAQWLNEGVDQASGGGHHVISFPGYEVLELAPADGWTGFNPGVSELVFPGHSRFEVDGPQDESWQRGVEFFPARQQADSAESLAGFRAVRRWRDLSGEFHNAAEAFGLSQSRSIFLVEADAIRMPDRRPELPTLPVVDAVLDERIKQAAFGDDALASRPVSGAEFVGGVVRALVSAAQDAVIEEGARHAQETEQGRAGFLMELGLLQLRAAPWTFRSAADRMMDGIGRAIDSWFDW